MCESLSSLSLKYMYRIMVCFPSANHVLPSFQPDYGSCIGLGDCNIQVRTTSLLCLFYSIRDLHWTCSQRISRECEEERRLLFLAGVMLIPWLWEVNSAVQFLLFMVSRLYSLQQGIIYLPVPWCPSGQSQPLNTRFVHKSFTYQGCHRCPAGWVVTNSYCKAIKIHNALDLQRLAAGDESPGIQAPDHRHILKFHTKLIYHTTIIQPWKCTPSGWPLKSRAFVTKTHLLCLFLCTQLSHFQDRLVFTHCFSTWSVSVVSVSKVYDFFLSKTK